MKTIGLVGGMTPESTRIYYEFSIDVLDTTEIHVVSILAAAS